MRNNDLEIKFERRFVLENLPEPLTRASAHAQFFDNYLTDTRLWLRRIRDPETKQWKYFFVQQFAVDAAHPAQTARAAIELNQYEYEVLAVFEGNELRYNRYSFALADKIILIDVFLNRELWNLIVATVEFQTASEMRQFTPPAFLRPEITENENLTAAKLTALTLADVQNYLNSALP